MGRRSRDSEIKMEGDLRDMSHLPVPVAPCDPKVDRLERELSKRINNLELKIDEVRNDLWHKKFNLEQKIGEVRSDLWDYKFKTEMRRHLTWTMALGLAILLVVGSTFLIAIARFR